MPWYPEVMADLGRSERPYLFKPFGAEVSLSTIGAVLQASGRGQMPEREAPPNGVDFVR